MSIADHPELSREACIAAAESTRRAREFWEEEANKAPSIKASDLDLDLLLDGRGYRLYHKPTGFVVRHLDFGKAARELQNLLDMRHAAERKAEAKAEADAELGLTARLDAIEARLICLEQKTGK